MCTFQTARAIKERICGTDADQRHGRAVLTFRTIAGERIVPTLSEVSTVQAGATCAQIVQF